jgi:hypothetical protein
MIDGVDAQLKTWVEEAIGITQVVFAPPVGALDDTVEAQVSFHLFQIVPDLPPRSMQRAPLQIILRYLVATQAATTEKAHRMIGELVFAAMENPAFQVDFEPLPAEFWLALGVIPQPSFVLRVPLVREREQPSAPLVRHPVVRSTSMAVLHGVVLSGEDIPVPGAVIEVPDLNLRQKTDTRGRFKFTAVPADPPVRHVRVYAKGRETDVKLDPEASASEPHIIRLHLVD